MTGVKRILRLLWEIIWLWEVRIGNFHPRWQWGASGVLLRNYL